MMDGASHEHCSTDILPYSWLFSQLENFADRSQGLLGLNQCGHKCWDTEWPKLNLWDMPPDSLASSARILCIYTKQKSYPPP